MYLPTFSELNVWGFPLVMAWISKKRSIDFQRFPMIFWRLLKIAENVWRWYNDLEQFRSYSKGDNNIIVYMYYLYAKIRAQSKGNWIEVSFLIMS